MRFRNGVSHNFLLKIAEKIMVKKLYYTDPKAVAELFNSDRTGIFAYAIHNIFQCGWRNSGHAGKLIDGKIAFGAKHKNPLGNGLSHIQNTTPLHHVFFPSVSQTLNS